ncbi:MAG: ABC transporter ATP-binding protein [Aestuariivita sp.]|nr:ABC transporter ATP-binding protein [Aestuariivita sp.]MCY4202643.1 ABC transporter ATP-binding protein [Aestuariivita sp.]MCY4288497.1 ABC transporter ATP-binding protein [Aestuariivita sp.]MCY4347081.1 ABC transporter ATP-binding protein [Aestuariivita sp.]
MIVTENVSKHFGGFRAIDALSMSIEPGKITGLIGPNGAGKTTLFNVIAGALAPTAGRVFFDGKDITGLPPHELFHQGLVRTFQIAQEFPTMTCRENLMMVPSGQRGEHLWNTWFNRRKIAQDEDTLAKQADQVLEFLTIPHLADQSAGNISSGQKKLLELGRTMMTNAQVVFLDEVGAGVNRTLLNTIINAVKELNRVHRYTFLIIEHDMEFIAKICDSVICMAEGKILASGSMAELKQNSAVIDAYLGKTSA